MTKNQTIAKQVIDELGGVSSVARILTIKPPSVFAWKEKGIPKAWDFYLRLKYPNLKAWSIKDES